MSKNFHLSSSSENLPFTSNTKTSSKKLLLAYTGLSSKLENKRSEI
jgi:hypothetical protein